jgi:ABC-type multidrug transport system fused ATPase/permease subunit
MSENNGIDLADLLRIISSYAKSGAECGKLARLYEVLSPLINPPNKEKEDNNIIYNNTKKSILEIIAGKEDKNRNITLDVNQWIEGCNREFTLSQCYADLCVVSKHDKDAVRRVLTKLKTADRIEGVGQKSGHYRVINRNIEYTDYKNIIQQPSIKLELPLGLHKRTLFFPKSLTAIAGVTGMGKTTWALNIMQMNQHKYKFKYFYNSELSSSALHQKLSYLTGL